MSSNHRIRRPSSATSSSSSLSFAGTGELIGKTTADFAGVCCCLPCAVGGILVLVFYKVPAGLIRRAMRRRRKKKSPESRRRQPSCSCGVTEIEVEMKANNDKSVVETFDDDLKTTVEIDKKLKELEEEMWEMFHATGFWRSLSQRQSPHKMSPKWEIKSPRPLACVSS